MVVSSLAMSTVEDSSAPEMIAPRPLRADADEHVDAGGGEHLVPLPRDAFVRVFERRDDAGDSGMENGFGARRRFADMRTRFQSDI